jgi:Rps23 Pro-64 3,4-dihydroxylase Tpa1-like proline 4-hydroxylase
MDRIELANHVVARLERSLAEVTQQWRESGVVSHCYVDDVLPIEVAMRIRQAYPSGESMKIRRSLRELKYVAAQMDAYDPILEEALYAFQDPRVVDLVGRITGLKGLLPDELLYAGGISMMSRGHFLNPHLDNSHDKNREMYRVLNLLYYVSPNWSLANGGNLELWPEGVEGKQITVESRFNRLAIMITNRHSWHSVSPIEVDDFRCCVSNYYFSEVAADDQDYFHVTSFRGRPEQPVRDLVLQADAGLRMAVRKLFPKGAVETKHYYDKKKS